ncbi:MAG: hypothetical protein LQ340_000390 [Diploschistes diacapsis]|nr:MAG: hypothetical protein LQ340_000390 [Diploschistes diacapsis]
MERQNTSGLPDKGKIKATVGKIGDIAGKLRSLGSMRTKRGVAPLSGLLPVLPREILIAIFSLLVATDRESLKAARLVCRVWAQQATMFLFDKVVISPQQENIDVLLLVLENPVLSLYVKEIIYDASSFADLSTPEEYCEEVLQSLCGGHAKMYNVGDASKGAAQDHYLKCRPHLGDAFPAYKQRYADQQALMVDRIPLLLEDCFRRFKNVHKVSIESGWIPEWKGKNFVAFKGPGVVARQWNPLELGPRPCEPGSLDDRNQWPLMVIARAVKKTNHVLEHLAYSEASSRENVLHWALQSNLSPIDLGSDYDAIQYFFCGLDSAMFALPYRMSTWWTPTQRAFQSMTAMLSMAQNLTQLNLYAWAWNNDRGCLAGQYFPALRRVFIVTGCYTLNELSLFLGRHSGTVERLKLYNVLLCGSWADLLDVIRSKMLRLHSFHFRGPPTQCHWTGRANILLRLLPGNFHGTVNDHDNEPTLKVARRAIALYCLGLSDTNWLRQPDLKVQHRIQSGLLRLLVSPERFTVSTGKEAARLLQTPYSFFD